MHTVIEPDRWEELVMAYTHGNSNTAGRRPSITQIDEDAAQMRAATESREGCAGDDWRPATRREASRLYLAICGACCVPALIYVAVLVWPRFFH